MEISKLQHPTKRNATKREVPTLPAGSVKQEANDHHQSGDPSKIFRAGEVWNELGEVSFGGTTSKEVFKVGNIDVFLLMACCNWACLAIATCRV